jgi:hypothetical protein|tara:strand:+ start:25184 stop:27043 length:1860 start_codon:yes stop_codon:yes gene_type:complete
MAIEKNIVIGADLSGLEKKLDELIAALKDSQKQADKTSAAVNEIADSTENIGESSKKSAKSMGKLGQSVGAIGKNLKGFFVLQFALDTIKELFDNNQQTVDFFATTFNTLQIAFSDFAKFISNNIGGFVDFFTSIFNNPLESVKSLGTAIKNNIIERFQSMLDVLGFVGDAMAKFFKGDFKGALESVKSAGSEMVDVLTGVDDSAQKIAEGTTKAAKAISNYVVETVKQGKAMTETNKQAEIAEVKAQGLIEKYDRQAEKIRQVRDDEKLSIQERIEANEALGDILDEQERTMLANAQAVVDAKARQLAMEEDNIEFQKEYQEALNELAAIEAQVDGFRSEYKMNQNSLDREAIDLLVSKKETEQEIAEIEAQTAIDAETNLFKQLELEETLNKELYDSRLAALEQQKSLYKEGTQSYQDMVNEMQILEKERTAQQGEEARKRRELEQATQQARLQMTGNAIGALNDLAQAFLGNNEKNARKAFMVNKALGISQAVVSTAQAVTAALTAGGNPIKLATGAQFVEAGIAAAVGAAQIATISSQQFQAGGGGGGGVNTNIPRPTAPTTAPRTPDFNVVGQSGTNALLQSLQDKPMKAFVVGSEVSTQQQLDRKKVQTSSIG